MFLKKTSLFVFLGIIAISLILFSPLAKATLSPTIFPKKTRVALQISDQPQTNLPIEPLVIITTTGQRVKFNVQLATTPQEQMTGLMFRRSLPINNGMLFVWPHPIIAEMWMKNTLIPLDMIFISKTGQITDLAQDTVPQSLMILSSTQPVLAVLEINGGLTAKDNIDVGDQVFAKQFGNYPLPATYNEPQAAKSVP